MVQKITDNIPEDVKKQMGIQDEEAAPKTEVVEIQEEVAQEPTNEGLEDTALGAFLEKKNSVEAPANNSFDDIFKNINVDLNNIQIVEKSPLMQKADKDYVLSAKSTFQVTALQSAYTAELSALSYNDINNIKNSTADAYNSRKKFYDILHSHLEATSLGKLGRKDFLKITSLHDTETLLYGIYCQTYPKDSKFDITCGSCKGTNKINVDNDSLIEVRPEKEAEVFTQLEEVMYKSKTPEDAFAKSLLSSKQRIMLEDSKIIVDIFTPSLADHLQLLSNINPGIVEQYEGTIGVMLFIKSLMMLDVQGTKQNGKPQFYPVTDKNEILDIITRLSPKDGAQLEKSLAERSEKYAITYSIKDMKCQHCNDSIGSIPVEMESLLFNRMAQEDQN